MTRRRWLALVVAPVALMAGGGVYLFAPRTAAQPPAAGRDPVALLLVATRPESALPGPPPTPAEGVAYRRAQAALVRSEFVLNAALRAPAARDALKGQHDPVGWLAVRLTAEYADGGEVLRVGVAGLPPREAAAVANAVAQAYLREAVERDRAAAMRRRKLLEDARADVRQKLERRRTAVTDLARAAGLPVGEGDHRAAVAALYQERAGLRVGVAGAAAGAEGKGYAAALADVDARIQKAEAGGPAVEAARAEFGALAAADAALAAELVRLELDAGAPLRVQMLKPATADPQKD